MKTVRALLSYVLLNPIVLVSVALVTGIIGIVLLLDMPAYTKRLTRAERLSPSSAASLAKSSQNREVMIEGRISEDNQKLHRDFVAYVREEYRDEFLDGDYIQRWVEVKRETPPLQITLADGEVRIDNDDYTFDTTAVTIEEAAPTVTKGAVQSRGYTVNSPVMLIGRVESGGSVKAEFLYAGSRSAYITEMRSVAARSVPVGVAFLAMSLLTGFLCVRELRRFLREIAAEREQAESEETSMARQDIQSPRQKRRNKAART